ncbi:N-acetylmuramoyl-L-alanine amidase [Microbispora cellulosiformans]|uniref:N-acetylmuramoyl-L-alanine amidase n=1 Tax=Microbispora cellulosiformans TaxID=2614688 RepID=A0A5J5K7D1_9ACTN|nr:peptidoglycan-binding domain-containing protein [Microbispora cellulosiformans]KAA9379594.1 N-acetylmuramoyl-L-alanine amidase [Microbispora cellulosiformans]
MDLIERHQWRARDPKGVVYLQAPPRGVKIHYMGARVDPGIVDDHNRCVEVVKSVQRQHMDVNLWGDIGYTGCACPHRKVFVGRGPGHLPAANGAGLNAKHYAILALLGDEGLVVPPPGLLHGLVDAIEWLRGEGAGREVKGHRDGYATDCPGDQLYAWVRQGARRPDDGGGAVAVPPWHRVLSYPPLMEGDDVRTWQARMRARGWRITVDGVFGPQSREICRQFQIEKRDLHVNPSMVGRVDRPTWEAAWTSPIT